MHHSSSRKLKAFVLIAGVFLSLAAPRVVHALPQSLSGGLGATSVNRDFPTCMNQTYGHHEKLTAEVLQGKLSSAKLSAQQRRETEEDIKWLNAIAGGAARNLPAPDPRNPQRYLLLLTDAEQVEINRKNSLFMNETRNKCEAQYGGMSQFADPSGRRGNAAISTDSVPPPADPSPVTAKPLQDFNNCSAARAGLRYKLMSERLSMKFAAAKNLSPAESKSWEEDIAVVRAAQSSPAKMPMSPDPKNPMRWMTRLTGDDHLAINQSYASESQALLNKCSAAARSGMNSSSGAATQSSAPAPSSASTARSAPEQQTTNSGGGSLSANLGATRADYFERSGLLACYDRMKGHMAKVTADKLEAKLKTVSGLTPQQRKEWNEDIASWRAAEAAKADQPVPPDPNNPNRWQSRLTRIERQEINMEHSAYVNKTRDECNSMDHMGIGKKPQ